MANKPQNNQRTRSNFGNYALGEQLQKFTPRIKTKNTFADVKKVTDLGPDGEDHINVYTNCKTELGAALSPFATTPFISPFYGKFNSRQGFYYYLLSKDGHEAFRTMQPVKMRSYAAGLSTMGFFCPNLRFHMATALWSQIKDNEIIKQKLIDNQLPFEAYYLKRQKFENVVSHIPARPNSNATWITRIVSVIANALKKGVTPVFDEFIDDKEQLERLKAKITRPLTPPPEPKPKKEKVKKEVTAVEALSTAVAAEQNVVPEVDSSIPAGVEGGPALPDDQGSSIANQQPVGRGLTSPIFQVDEGPYQQLVGRGLTSPIFDIYEIGFSQAEKQGYEIGFSKAEKQGLDAVDELREALSEGSNSTSPTDLKPVVAEDQSSAECTLDQAPE
jgi:hypothetical protein